MKDIVVLVSGNGTNLQALINACKSKKIKHGQIKMVICSNLNAFALKRAKIANIETAVISKQKFQSNELFNKCLLEKLKKINPHLIVLAGFMHIISPEIVAYFKNKIINIHPSLIPSFCGMGYFGLNVHKKVLERGVKITGATVHFVNEHADAGPIIAQKAVEITEKDTPQTLQKKVMQQAEWQLLPQAVEWFCSEKIKISNNKVFIERNQI